MRPDDAAIVQVRWRWGALALALAVATLVLGLRVGVEPVVQGQVIGRASDRLTVVAAGTPGARPGQEVRIETPAGTGSAVVATIRRDRGGGVLLVLDDVELPQGGASAQAPVLLRLPVRSLAASLVNGWQQGE